MSNSVKFQRVEAGVYNVIFNGELLAVVRNMGANCWNLDEQTEAFETFYDNTDRHFKWLLDDNFYTSKGQIVEAFKCAAGTFAK